MRKWWPRSFLLAGCVLAAVLIPGIGNAQYRGGTIKIGVLNDQSGLYADIAGTASVWMARKAVEDFGAAAKGMKVEIIGGDHQNKPDIGLSIARQWFDVDKVDAIADVPTSSVALAISSPGTRTKYSWLWALRLPISPVRRARPTPCIGSTTLGRWRTAPAMRL